MSTQENNQEQKNLSNEELQNTNGGLLGLGGDNNMLKGVLQGSVNVHDTNRDGETRSQGIDLGLGSILNSEND